MRLTIRIEDVDGTVALRDKVHVRVVLRDRFTLLDDSLLWRCQESIKLAHEQLDESVFCSLHTAQALPYVLLRLWHAYLLAQIQLLLLVVHKTAQNHIIPKHARVDHILNLLLLGRRKNRQKLLEINLDFLRVTGFIVKVENV